MENTAETIIQQEQQQEGQTAEQQQTKPDNTPDWVPKRMGELAAARRAAEQRAEQERIARERLEQELAQLRNNGGEHQQHQPAAPVQNVEELARAYAERMVKESREQEQLATRLTSIEETGKKEFGEDFDRSVNNLSMAGIGSPQFLQAISKVPNADKVLVWLGKSENINEAMRVASLDPIDMGIELSQMSGKAAKALSKQLSKAPPPVGTVEGGSSGGSGEAMPDPKTNPREFIEWRNKNARKRR